MMLKEKTDVFGRITDIDVLNLKSLAARAKPMIGPGEYGYISEGSDDGYTMARNTTAFEDVHMLPRVLRGVESPNQQIEFMGSKLSSPLLTAPIAGNTLAHSSGEIGLAKGAKEAGIMMSQSTFASKTIAETAEISDGAPYMFQLYMPKDWAYCQYLLDEARQANASAIILTADSTLGGYRELDVINHYHLHGRIANLEGYNTGQKGVGAGGLFKESMQNLDLALIDKLAAYSKLPIIIKGIQTPEDANAAIEAGAAGIYVSNHGGRQLDGAPGSIEVLPTIAQVVDHRVPIIFDGGVQRGTHVLKALALGADLIGVGRPFSYGLALGGWQGVRNVAEQLKSEINIAMQLTGCQTIADVKKMTCTNSFKI
ncbi:lactate oxidase [Latilactobacillus sakei]|nr:alpha-hydroxy-acid oxidizing protein [Latilactobacillus sakei]EOR85922.1 lactate 2-monooxygenase [Latilactobacillus sakei subsp. sakei LS25]PKX63625.1 lactate oxidase [Latilactobacillus sakei]PKX69131.1 lactate oxidase [Latilactobacillus sakei]